MTRLFDTHAHLSDPRFDADRMEALDRASAAGVAAVVEVADSPEDWEKALALSSAAGERPGAPRVLCSLGLHPYYAERHSRDLLKAFEALAAPGRAALECPVAAVGEIGLDYVKSEVPRAAQIRALEEWLAAAKGWGKPAVIHCRGAFDDLRPILKNIFQPPLPLGERIEVRGDRRSPSPLPSPIKGEGEKASRFWGVIHCFSGSNEDARELSALGFALGVDGPVTYPKNDALRAALKDAGTGSLVLETDSPYLPPQSFRGKRNEPAHLAQIAAKTAEALGVPEPELAAKTTENALELFRLSSSFWGRGEREAGTRP